MAREVLKSEQHDAEEYIGMNFSTMEDKMILKDEMTVVLVKDNNYFWAKRMSEKDPAGLYGSYF